MQMMLAGICGERKLVYVVPLEDDVDHKMWTLTRRACDEAVAANADVIVFHINTYGGEVDAADSIRTAILRMPMTTVAFVDHNAASAGALITLACDSVYLSPDASYGASTVVSGVDGSPAADKYQSYMKSIMRSTAESKGKIYNATDSTYSWRRDPVRAEHFVTVDSVLTFTAREAVDAHFAEGISNSLNEVISKQISEPYEVVKIEPTTSDHILGFLGSPLMRVILIVLIVGGIYMEMQTPGLGFAGCIAFVAATLYFLPMIVSGTIAPWVIVTFVIGMLLLAMEIFVIPGFGVCGVMGMIAVVASVIGGMIDSSSLENAYAVDLVQALGITGSALVLAVALVWFLTSKHGPKCVRRVSELQTELKDSEGYIGVDTSIAKFVGREAETVTDMRPAGKISIEGTEYDAVSMTGYIDACRIVKVVKFENAQLYVKKI